MRAIGYEYGYYTQDDWKKAAFIDMIVETYSEVFDACAKILFLTKEADRPAALDTLKDGLLTKFMTMCEKELQNNSFSKFMVGDHLTIVDFCLASFAFNILKNENGPFEAAFSNVAMCYPFFGAYIKRMQTEFAIQLQSRSRYNMI